MISAVTNSEQHNCNYKIGWTANNKATMNTKNRARAGNLIQETQFQNRKKGIRETNKPSHQDLQWQRPCDSPDRIEIRKS